MFAFAGEGTIEYEVLQVLPFDSVRKRMTVVLRHAETRQIVVYCKGADSAVLPRLAYTRPLFSFLVFFFHLSSLFYLYLYMYRKIGSLFCVRFCVGPSGTWISFGFASFDPVFFSSIYRGTVLATKDFVWFGLFFFFQRLVAIGSS